MDTTGPCSICKKIHDFIMRVFQAIRDFFNPRPNSINPQPVRISPQNPPQNFLNLLPFYRGLEANNRGVTLEQILNWDDQRLESQHDYIQWLFPLETRSGPNPTAPILNSSIINTFRNDPGLQAQIVRSFQRMLSFYGLQENTLTGQITRAPNFHNRRGVWLQRNNHNFLRITRIIHSLCLLGLPLQAQAFLNIMQDIYNNEGRGIISQQTFQYWQGAFRAF